MIDRNLREDGEKAAREVKLLLLGKGGPRPGRGRGPAEVPQHRSARIGVGAARGAGRPLVAPRRRCGRRGGSAGGRGGAAGRAGERFRAVGALFR